MSIRAHENAVKESLLADLPESVFASYSTTKGKSRYAVVFIALSKSEQSRFTAGQTRDTFTVTVHNCGESKDSAQWVEERVLKLKGKVLTVPGRKLWPVEYVTGQPLDLDEDGENPIWFSISQFDIVSDPA